MKDEIKKEALMLLSKRDYFSQELTRKLLLKGYDGDEVKKVIDFLEKEGYIDDKSLKKRYKELAVEKGKSKLYIKKKLYEKGVDLAIDFSFEEELQSAKNLLKNKYRKEKEFKKVVKFLLNRGFNYDIAKQAAVEFLNFKH